MGENFIKVLYLIVFSLYCLNYLGFNGLNSFYKKFSEMFVFGKLM